MSNSRTSEKGSIWRKWDLHIHTPFTKLNDQFSQVDDEDIWKTFSEKVENSDVKALGITDYFSADNYFKFCEKFRDHYPNSEKVFFLNIEFRLDVAVNKKGEEVNLHIVFSDEVRKSEIEDFLAHLETNHTNQSGAKISCKNLKSDQFVSATVSHNLIIGSLRKVFGNDKPYLVIGASNNSGLRPDSQSPRKLSISDEIDKICDAFFGGQQNVEYFLNEDRYETAEKAKPKPVISGCDAHSFTDMDEGLGKRVTKVNTKGVEETVRDITWIKGDLTFTGLKQILFEPEYRITISAIQPRVPVRRIESIKFNFPTSTYIKKHDSSEQQDFCLKNIRTELYFSDYFTSVIGGRGTGKSTIINLLAEKLNEKTDFFGSFNNTLTIEGKNYDTKTDPSNYIEIKGTNEIEFVSQGKIEKLAEGDELTKLIFNDRIRETEVGFNEIEQDFQNTLEKIDENIRLLSQLMNNSDNKISKTRERDTKQKVIDSINDERYVGITSSIKDLRNELSQIQTSSKKYESILDQVKSITSQFSGNDGDNPYEQRVQEIVKALIELDELEIRDEDVFVTPKKYDQVTIRLTEIHDDLNRLSTDLKSFFQEKGTNEETIKDSQQAAENVSRLNKELNEIESENNRLWSKYKSNEEIVDQLSTIRDRNKNLIDENLTKINSRLEVRDENVLKINFSYEFDKLQFKNSLFNEFYLTFSKYHISGTSKSQVQEVLFLIEPDEDLLLLDHNKFKEKLTILLDSSNYRNSNNYVKLVLDVFARKGNYLIYLNLVKKHFYDLSQFIKVKGYYGNRELSSCSFGQRCTAVIVTLLLTGVKPLVIDEPEAHLDNKLVADYLVGLLKDKQLDRQIIFASHNSNFVINGDSGLIHILTTPSNSTYTTITSTTIENTDYRNELMKLEGGEAAFLTRENKYGIQHN